jgi:replicative DNA helicase
MNEAELNNKTVNPTNGTNAQAANFSNAPKLERNYSILDRLPPHSLEAEQGVLGCILLSPNDTIPVCIEKTRGDSRVFYDLRHRRLFEVLTSMFDQNEPIDLITLQQRLKDNNMLESVGGLAYILSLPDAVPSAANIKYYLDIVREKYLLRRTIQTCNEAISRVYEFEGDVDALLDEVEKEFLNINQERIETGIIPIKKLVEDAISQIYACYNRRGTINGIPTGFTEFDNLTNGLKPGQMIVIAARPGIGKTSFAMNIAENVVLNSKIPTGVFSLEMNSDALIMRMLCSQSRLSMQSIKRGFITPEVLQRLSEKSRQLSSAPLYIDDTPGLSILQLRTRARRMFQQYAIKLFVIDYLQLLHSTSRRVENRQQEIADISNGIKALSKELNVPIIVLSQLNREVEREKNRKPRLSDLRESGAIEQDADIVALLYKPGKDEDEEQTSTKEDLGEPVPMSLLIAKQRNGPTGEVQLLFHRAYTRFDNVSKINIEDAPVD